MPGTPRKWFRSVFHHPVANLEVLFHLTAFVPVLVGFVGSALDVPELMFGISDQFGQNLRSFAHGFFTISFRKLKISLNNANFIFLLQVAS